MPWLDILSIETPDGQKIQVDGLKPEEPYPIQLLSAEHGGHTYGLRYAVATTAEGRFPVAYAHADGETVLFDANPQGDDPTALARWFHAHGCPPQVVLTLLHRSMAECSLYPQRDDDDFLRRN